MSRSQGRGLTLPILASALLAALLVAGVFVGAASATETPPENTVPPTMNPTTPQVGVEVIGSPGTWTGATSYAYNWLRCVPAGSCEKLTYHGKRYTPVVADVGKQLVFQVEATNPAGTTKAATTRSSKVTAAPENPPLSWYSCGVYEGSGELFATPECNSTGAENLFSWRRLTSGQTETLNSTLTGPFNLSWNAGGVIFRVSCTAGSGEGTLVQAASQAEITGYQQSLSSCTMVQPTGAGCVVKGGGSIVLNSLKGHSPAAPETLNPEIRFEPTAGGAIVEFFLEGCTPSVLNGSRKVTGWIPTQVNNAKSILAAESSGTVKVSGVPAEISFASHIYGHDPLRPSDEDALKLELAH